MTENTVFLTPDEFKTAVHFEKEYQQKATERLVTYYYATYAILQREYRNPIAMLRSFLQNEHRLLFELPLATKEIDALCLRGDGVEYTLLNSSQPKVHTTYTLCRAFFYFLTTADKAVHARVKPFYSIHNYTNYDNLYAATFANLFLLPEPFLREKFYQFYAEQKKEDTTLSVLAKLMNYYEVPYAALLTRCYSLGLLDQKETREELLQVDMSRLQAEFHRLWLDESLLQPTLKDEYFHLEELVKSTGNACIEEEYLKQQTLNTVLSNMRTLYSKIREV